ncbi:MAG: NUDIX domain-containing protein, partial [Acidimicrobiales bacterium]
MPPGEAVGSFRSIGERQRLEGGFFSVVSGTFVGPDGFTFEREIVRHPGAVAIVALEDDGQSVLMVSQYRGAVDKCLLELPAGKRDILGEAPALCAARELAEEIGRSAA